MEQTEIPTFPLERKAGVPVPVLIILSLAGGMAGAALLFSLFPELRKAVIPPGTESVIVSSPGTVVVEEGARVVDVVRQSKTVVASIFKKGNTTRLGSSVVYPHSSASGSAIMLTADGWFGTVQNANVLVGDILIVDNVPFEIKTVYKDSASPFVLGKVEGAHFASVTFSEPDNVAVGMTVVATTGEEDGERLSLVSLTTPFDSSDKVLTSDRLTYGYGVSSLRLSTVGIPVFSLRGDLVGLTTSSTSGATVLVPADVLQSLLDQQIQFSNSKRASLGITYVRASVQGDVSGMIRTVVASAAKSASIPVGSIIVSIDEEIVEDADIFRVISKKQPGQTVTLKYRSGVESSQIIEKTVILGELST
ncbi:MAG: S1C family serine protease [Patescibacteria group bacterium]|jgi:hypothetical protein